MFYHKKTYLRGSLGNNAFAYTQRAINDVSPCLCVPSLVHGNIRDVQLGNEVVFAERDEKKQIVQEYTGLTHLVQRENGQKRFFVMDNHNHAFFAWRKAVDDGLVCSGAQLIHIDQHSDLAQPRLYPTQKDIVDHDAVALYTNHVLHVGSFIKPAIQCGLIQHQEQIRSERSLLHANYSFFDQSGDGKRDSILDIDLDFRAKEMLIEDYAATIDATKSFIYHPQVKLVTIATSPYFMDQQRAMSVLHDLLS